MRKTHLVLITQQASSLITIVQFEVWLRKKRAAPALLKCLAIVERKIEDGKPGFDLTLCRIIWHEFLIGRVQLFCTCLKNYSLDILPDTSISVPK